ncbi:adenylyltransferase and sulfurtransferase MOCS3 isoform X2 [Chiloscyllium plagiosum]|uniref:adenylyltransferase and sulfurtransferase MOCS3 isoform X1 n=1 Tax=Chiloscyllium plagiosum TaxID=36176 RepID=UPI001CB88037|nr:adenylyltransferase and sulfurtransferase MOCS3 isoform X1 [Chiloscyllium plagiosum]XP_043551489.1 adenylyltransferase and sulfurtransferase MOCS3 isoform X2 [Chiloscyllium plagiosum]
MEVERLRDEMFKKKEKEVERLRDELFKKEQEVQRLKAVVVNLQQDSRSGNTFSLLKQVTEMPPLEEKSLSNEEILRYSRQLIIPEFGVKGQLNLSKKAVLIVGCGGLGCPAAQYLAAAGIGRLGLLDYDDVELTNLQRQILHTEDKLGVPKALSAAIRISQLNSNVECIPYHFQLSYKNARQLIQQYDIVVDCSDNVPTRFLVNDACVLNGKPLVSASALRMEGQLTVYNYNGGPCYRCLYPKPPPAETVTNCSDGGVLGIVPGILGCIQALEVLKIASGIGSSYSQQMLIFDALEARFRTIKLRSKQPTCAVCGDNPTVKDLIDYEKFCGSAATDQCRTLHLLTGEQRITVQEYKQLLDQGVPHILVDVRPQVEVDICKLPHSIYFPLAKLEEKNTEYMKLLQNRIITSRKEAVDETAAFPVYVICKQGNDSQKAVKILQEILDNELSSLSVKDIQGGLMAWACKIDPTFPQY